MSFCVDTVFTLLGLVKQGYTLPDDIIKQMGIETFDSKTFEVEGFKLDSFYFDTFGPDNLEITFLRRCVILLSRMGCK